MVSPDDDSLGSDPLHPGATSWSLERRVKGEAAVVYEIVETMEQTGPRRLYSECVRVSVEQTNHLYRGDLKKAVGKDRKVYLIITFIPDGSPLHGNIARHQGLATRMLDRILQDAVADDCDFVALLDSHPDVQAFFTSQRYGFAHYERPKPKKGMPEVPSSLFYKRLL